MMKNRLCKSILCGLLAAQFPNASAQATPDSSTGTKTECLTHFKAFDEAFQAVASNAFDTDYSRTTLSDFETTLDELPDPDALLSTCLPSETMVNRYDRVVDVAIQYPSKTALQNVDDVWKQLGSEQKQERAKTLHRLNISARRFQSASELRDAFGINWTPPASLPTSRPNGERSVMTYENHDLVTAEMKMIGWSGILIIGHPGCHFTSKAWPHLREQPWSDNARIITGAWVDMDATALATVNARTPDMPFNIVWSEAEWPEITYWGTPAFFAYKDGKVIGHHIGWPRGQEMQTLARLDDLAMLTRQD